MHYGRKILRTNERTNAFIPNETIDEGNTDKNLTSCYVFEFVEFYMLRLDFKL